jgi:hypothetical protein
MPDAGIGEIGALVGGIGGAAGSLLGGSSAASGSKAAADTQRQMYLTTRADLAPFVSAGTSVLPQLTSLATSGPTGGGPNYIDTAAANVPPTMTQAELEKTPGYQFNLSQGLKAVQAAAAARGLGVSGASIKGAATYATGLADSTYQNQFANAQQRFADYLNLNTAQQGQVQNQYARLHDTATLGANAAAQTGQTGATLAGNAGQYLQGAGLANAAGITGVGNALTGAANNYLAYNTLQNALASGNGTTGGYQDTGRFNV